MNLSDYLFPYSTCVQIVLRMDTSAVVFLQCIASLKLTEGKSIDLSVVFYVSMGTCVNVESVCLQGTMQS